MQTTGANAEKIALEGYLPHLQANGASQVGDGGQHRTRSNTPPIVLGTDVNVKICDNERDVPEKPIAPFAAPSTDKLFKSNRNAVLLPVPSDIGSIPAELGSVLLQRQNSATSFAQAQNGCKRFVGIFCAIAAGFVFIFASVAATKLVARHNSMEVGFFRFLFVPLFALPVMMYRRINPFSLTLMKEYGALLICRGLVGSCGFLLRITAFARLPLGDATTIFFTTPVFVGIMAKLFLGERYHKTYLVATILAFTGCVLISRPSLLFPVNEDNQIHLLENDELPETTKRLEGCVAALLAACTGGVVYVVLRRPRKVNPAVTIFYFGLGGTLTSGAGALITTYSLPWPDGWQEWLWIGIMSAASNVGQWFFTLALRYENANVVALFGAGDVVWAFLAQIIFFSIAPQLLSVAGAALIVSSVLFVALRKLIESLPETSRARHRLATWPICVWWVPRLRPKSRRHFSVKKNAELSNAENACETLPVLGTDAVTVGHAAFAATAPEDLAAVQSNFLNDVGRVESASSLHSVDDNENQTMVADAVVIAGTGEGALAENIEQDAGI